MTHIVPKFADFTNLSSINLDDAKLYRDKLVKNLDHVATTAIMAKSDGDDFFFLQAEFARLWKEQKQYEFLSFSLHNFISYEEIKYLIRVLSDVVDAIYCHQNDHEESELGLV